jgi:hypothetical protein
MQRVVVHRSAGAGDCSAGAGNCSVGDLAIHLPTCSRRVGVKLPHHLLPLHCCAVEKFNHSRSFFTAFWSEQSF